MLDNIINWYRQRKLRLLVQKRGPKRISNWNSIHSIALLFVVGSEGKWNRIKNFISTQEKKGKKIFAVGLLPKGLSINYIFSHTETTICNEKEDLSFLGLPKKGIVDHFLERHYDLLIDATEQPCFFGKYLSASSDADLKVGYSNSMVEDEGILDMYDLTIQGDNNMDFNIYVEQVVKYLTLIKK